MTALLPALLCGGGMLVCFVLMSRMHGKGGDPGGSNGAASGEDVAALREELARLRAELGHDDRARNEPSVALDGRPTEAGEAPLQRQEQRLPRA